MALDRISFADDAVGTGEYIIPLNPYAISGFEPTRNLRLIELNPIDSFQTSVSGRKDLHVRTLKWRFKSDQSAYMTMYSTLKGYEFTGTNYKYYKDGDIGFVSSYTKIRVLSVSRSVDPKVSKNAVWYQVELVFEVLE